jgi:hypothetical protein
MKKEADLMVKSCDQCQRFSPLIHQPAEQLNPLSSPWPFAQWGLDIVGKFPVAPGGFKFLITATDYFTKWIEAEPLVRIEDKDVKRFVWRNIITRFGIPYAFISDNGTQFVGDVFTDFCAEHRIRFFNSTPSYPQCNGQAEASNKILLGGIKKTAADSQGKMGRGTVQCPLGLPNYTTPIYRTNTILVGFWHGGRHPA